MFEEIQETPSFRLWVFLLHAAVALIGGFLRIFTESDHGSQPKAITVLRGKRSPFSRQSDQRFQGKPITDRLSRKR